MMRPGLWMMMLVFKASVPTSSAQGIQQLFDQFTAVCSTADFINLNGCMQGYSTYSLIDASACAVDCVAVKDIMGCARAIFSSNAPYNLCPKAIDDALSYFPQTVKDYIAAELGLQGRCPQLLAATGLQDVCPGIAPLSSQITPQTTSLGYVSPRYGPLGGGTEIHLSGTGMKQVATVHIGISRAEETRCRIIKRDDSEVVAVTRAAWESVVQQLQPIAVIAYSGGNPVLVASAATFTYLPDPVLTDVYPLTTILSGGTTLTVDGHNFNSVSNPTLLVTVKHGKNGITSESVFSRPCGIHGDRRLHCETPTITVEPALRHLLPYLAGSGIGQYSLPAEYIELCVGLNFPGYEDLCKVQGVQGNLYVCHIAIVPLQASLEFWPYTSSSIDILGQSMDVCGSKEDYKISVGEGQCQVLSVSATSLTCTPPAEKPPGEDELGFPVKMKFGNRPEDMLGYIQYQYSYSTALAMGLSFGAMVVLVVIIVAVVVVRKRQQRRRPDQSKPAGAGVVSPKWKDINAVTHKGNLWEKGESGIQDRLPLDLGYLSMAPKSHNVQYQDQQYLAPLSGGGRGGRGPFLYPSGSGSWGFSNPSLLDDPTLLAQGKGYVNLDEQYEPMRAPRGREQVNSVYPPDL